MDALQVVVDRLCEATKTGKLKWELVAGNYCTYKTLNENMPCCVVSCCRPDFIITVEGQSLDVPCEHIMRLCSEIIQQVKIMKSQKTVSWLDAVIPKQENGDL